MSPDNAPAVCPDATVVEQARPAGWLAHSRLQVMAWVILVTLGVIQTWQVRHFIYSDGVTYLDIAEHYVRGDWKHAVSDYWSPLFPGVLAGVFKVLTPPAYWQAATLHAVNFVFFVLSLLALEFFLRELFRKQARAQMTGRPLPSATIRLAAYSALMWTGLHVIGIGSVTPDMIAMALTLLACCLLLRVDSGTARPPTYLGLGAALGLGFLDRAALLPMIPICLAVILILLRRRRVAVWRPLLWASLPAAALILPFLIAMAIANGQFTFGTTGKLNYAWEVAGATRHIHWQGEPGDIGAPKHPSKKVLNNPATYTFVDDVPGAYPLWYRPSYWHEGVQPRLKPGPQIRVLLADTVFLGFLLLLSPIMLPVLGLVALGGWRRWLSSGGVRPYLFLLIPMLLSAGIYCIVFLERRYVAGQLVVIWLCLMAGVSVEDRLRRRANVAVLAFIALFSAGAFAKWMSRGAVEFVSDIVHMREAEWNVQWMLADGFRKAGLAPGDRIAYIGQSIDSDWVRMSRAKIVAEVPVVWERYAQLNRAIKPNKREIEAFWSADAPTRDKVLQAFRDAGANFAVADKAPAWAIEQGWTQVLPPGTPHLPDGSTAQPDFAVTTAYLKLTR